MKKLLLFVLGFLALNSVLANDESSSNLFTESKKYSYQFDVGTYPWPTFSKLEMLGVERAAEVAALKSCTDSKKFNSCVITETKLDKCNVVGEGTGSNSAIICKASATVMGIN